MGDDLMKKCTLVIMAAGIGSRYGVGIKQLEPVGPGGEIIMDYSVFDAVAAGFDKVVFIIRHDIEKDFIERIGERISKKVNVSYVFQETSDIPEAHKKIKRSKPGGPATLSSVRRTRSRSPSLSSTRTTTTASRPSDRSMSILPQSVDRCPAESWISAWQDSF